MTCRMPAPYEPGLGAEDPRRRPALVAVLGEVGLRVRADEVLVDRLVERGDQPHGVVEHRHDVREGVAEEAGDPHGHVDARAAELLERYDVQVADPARRLVPLGPDAEQREHLGDVVAGGAHRGGAPDREPDRRRGSRRSRRGSAAAASRPSPTPVSQASRDGTARGSTV